jgi:fatty acid desaturase
MAELQFTPRCELSSFEWDCQTQHWQRLKLDGKTLTLLSKRSNLHGLLRVFLFMLSLVILAMAVVYVSRYSLWLAIAVLYAYYFMYGFLVAIVHELQHKIVFARSLDWLSEIISFFVQVLVWNGPCYARISHQLHHRYTMVRGIDPETAWPEVITTKWLRKTFWGLVLKVLVIGALVDIFLMSRTLIQRALGIKDRMMRDHCSDRQITLIRIESLAILLIHAAVVAGAVWFRRWEPIIFITLAHPIGTPIETFWHSTEHIGRLYNVNDQRLCTRSVRVSPFIHLFFGGLDDHVDHHLFPGVPSRNLPKLHKILVKDLAEPKTMIQCWREMFAIAKEKDNHPESEYVPITL